MPNNCRWDLIRGLKG